MQLDELLREGETQTRTLELLGTCRLKLSEKLKEFGKVLAPDPDPGIGYGNLDEIATVKGIGFRV